MKNYNLLKTSALISNHSLKLIMKAKKISGYRNISDVLSNVFKSIVNKYASLNKPIIRNTVKYQQHDSNLILIHYSVDPEIYEACVALRSFNKISVSKMLNEGIVEFLSFLFSNDSQKNSYAFHNSFSNSDNYIISFDLISKYTRFPSSLNTFIKIKIKKISGDKLRLFNTHQTNR